MGHYKLVTSALYVDLFYQTDWAFALNNNGFWCIITDTILMYDSGQADIYSFNLLKTLHMAHDAWDDVTTETIENCWNHADIQCDPIVLHILLTLIQKGWNVIHAFADPSSGTTLPQAKDALKKIFSDQYNDDYWRPALKVVTETEPDEDACPLVKALQQKSNLKKPFTPIKYTKAAADVASAIKELKQRK